MAQETETISKLQRLIQIYDEGYRSVVVDQAVDKLIALEIAQTKAELQRLHDRLQTYEARYDMPSDVFYRRFRAGELGDDMDFVEWSVFWDMHQAAARRLDALMKQADDAG